MSLTTNQLKREYQTDKQNTQKESGVLALIILTVGAILFILPMFTTHAQPEGQLASGVNECVAQCIIQ